VVGAVSTCLGDEPAPDPPGAHVHEKIRRADRLKVNALVGLEYKLSRKMFLFRALLNYFGHSLFLLRVQECLPLSSDGRLFGGFVG
jgi:hypothetical protein